MISKHAGISCFTSYSQWLATRRSAKTALWYLPIIRRSLEKCETNSKSALIDIGANIGLHSCTWSTMFPETIYCFEPLDVNLRCLKQNLRDVGAKKCEIVAGAVAERNGTMSFRRNVASPQNAKLNIGSVYPCEDVIEIPTYQLDDFANDHKIERIRLLKIDTGGAESKVLHGARNLIADNRIDSIFCEVCANQLEDMGSSIEEQVDLFPKKGGQFMHSENGLAFTRISRSDLHQIDGGDLLFFRFENE